MSGIDIQLGARMKFLSNDIEAILMLESCFYPHLMYKDIFFNVKK